jgi:hypothetical protein
MTFDWPTAVCKHSARLIASVLFLFLLPLAGLAQPTEAQDGDETTITGTVTSSSPNTLVVRSENGRYQLFVFDRFSSRQRSIAARSRVRITSVPSGEPGVRVARNIVVLEAAAAGTTTSAGTTGRPGTGSTDPIITGSDEVLPEAISSLERSIQREVRRFQIGARTGLALDPELVLAGVHAQFATGLNRNVIFRPNLEFAFGELTTAFAINLEALYRLPVSSRQARWGAYVGAGPGINFLKQSLTRRDRDVDFSDLDTDVSLNLFGGIQNRNGMFLEMKTSVYADPAPSLRLIVGFNF